MCFMSVLCTFLVPMHLARFSYFRRLLCTLQNDKRIGENRNRQKARAERGKGKRPSELFLSVDCDYVYLGPRFPSVPLIRVPTYVYIYFLLALALLQPPSFSSRQVVEDSCPPQPFSFILVSWGAVDFSFLLVYLVLLVFRPRSSRHCLSFE